MSYSTGLIATVQLWGQIPEARFVFRASKRKNQFGEYVVRCFRQSDSLGEYVRYEQGDYFASDIEDASLTLEAMQRHEFNRRDKASDVIVNMAASIAKMDFEEDRLATIQGNHATRILWEKIPVYMTHPTIKIYSRKQEKPRESRKPTGWRFELYTCEGDISIGWIVQKNREDYPLAFQEVRKILKQCFGTFDLIQAYDACINHPGPVCSRDDYEGQTVIIVG